MAIALFAAGFEASGAERMPSVLHCPYVIKSGDNLSMLLFEKGIGTKTSPFHLYGKNGWVKKNKERNPQVVDWSQIEIGSDIALVFPKTLLEKCTKEEAPLETPAAPVQLQPQPSMPPPVQEKDVRTLPQSPRKSLKSKSRPQKDERYSIDLPNLRNLASASVDLRYAKSLEPGGDTLLLPRLAQYAVVFESRYAALKKIRVYFDYMPRVSEDFLEKTFYVESTRLFLGRAFLWDLGPIATLELTPKIGYWRYESVLPLVDSDGVRAEGLGFTRQLSIGGDVGLSRRFGILTPRLWHGREFTANFLKASDSGAGQNYRTGFETRVDGPNVSLFGASTHVYLVGFMMQEATRITNGTANLVSGVKDNVGHSTATSGDERKDVNYQVNYGGLGLGLSW
ncbi:MAG: hypothetical protein NT027_03760 [Proteobacteria bacterium]|nr:hypothetical protein [Pseudomonadota bacterium]